MCLLSALLQDPGARVRAQRGDVQQRVRRLLGARGSRLLWALPGCGRPVRAQLHRRVCCREVPFPGCSWVRTRHPARWAGVGQGGLALCLQRASHLEELAGWFVSVLQKVWK